ncbi:hypothetical protein C5167_014337 [Papaver somniferum]|uniref:Uncharacterized protein n=1 Tax=Papaver somniferum TaxID=3469 RepID=A0A4Y7J768_PAPSO|nr:hypothetical protein C5167_014337 [Papaver somniferum]
MKTVSFLLTDNVKRFCEIKAQLVGYINQRTKPLLFFADANLRDVSVNDRWQLNDVAKNSSCTLNQPNVYGPTIPRWDGVG